MELAAGAIYDRRHTAMASNRSSTTPRRAVAAKLRPRPPIAAAMPSATTSAAPLSANPIVEWLLAEGWNDTNPRSFTERLAGRLVAMGFPLMRLRITIRTLHPLVAAVSYTWQRGKPDIEIYEPPHRLMQTDSFLKSPYAAILEGAGAIRRRLDIPGASLEFGILEELKAEGATDYVALPITFADGKIAFLTLATDRAGGFATAELETVYEILPALSRLLEVHALRRTATTLLQTYLGRHTGARVLDGQVKRGDGDDIHAVIWFCDLRDSTALADSMSRPEFLSILNDFFDCMAGPVIAQGGEVLRFIGDAALAIFPIVEGDDASGRDACTRFEACRNAVAAARMAKAEIEALNVKRAKVGARPLGFGIGLHIGDVLYGNIGVVDRLEFTVIGAAANEAAKLQALCKKLGRSLLVSAKFARHFPGEFQSLGEHVLPGVAQPQEIFVVPDL